MFLRLVGCTHYPCQVCCGIGRLVGVGDVASMVAL